MALGKPSFHIWRPVDSSCFIAGSFRLLASAASTTFLQDLLLPSATSFTDHRVILARTR